VLCLLEVGILYLLIAVDTPVAPLVSRLLRNPPGVFTLVMFVVTTLCAAMAAFLSWVEWLHKRRSTPAEPPDASWR
jgi:hypothetical protein